MSGKIGVGETTSFYRAVSKILVEKVDSSFSQ